MRLTPPELEIAEDGFSGGRDIFGLRKFAEKLSNLVYDIDQPLVIVLDGPWGSGKSTFVRQWAGLLREQNASVIMFDAFQSDHHEDAFLPIAAEIHNTAKDVLGRAANSTRRYFNKAKKAGAALAPVVLRVASRATTAGILSVEDLDGGGEALKAAVKSLGDEGTKALETAIADRLRSAGRERTVLESFRQTLSELADSLAKGRKDGQGLPLVFIIDELDRCRPPFALSVIERVKHLFSVPGVCFVLVAHMPQLEQAVKGSYGVAFDAKTYLEKFYHLRIILPDHTANQKSQRSAYLQYLWRTLEIGFASSRIDELVKAQLDMLADIYELSLRGLERVMTHIALACAAAGAEPLLAPLVAGLCVMRQTHPQLYKKALKDELSWDEARQFLQPSGLRGVEDEWALGFWKYATGAEMSPEESMAYRRNLVRNEFSDRAYELSYTANHIEVLAQR